MGTRSNTIVQELGLGAKPVRLVNMYRQFDGYPSGHGKELTEFILSGELVSGIYLTDPGKVFNGAGCFAAAMVHHFKDGPGGIYLEQTAGTLDNDYAYFVGIDTFDPSRPIEVTVKSGKKRLFSGDPAAFKKWCVADNDR